MYGIMFSTLNSGYAFPRSKKCAYHMPRLRSGAQAKCSQRQGRLESRLLPGITRGEPDFRYAPCHNIRILICPLEAPCCWRYCDVHDVTWNLIPSLTRSGSLDFQLQQLINRYSEVNHHTEFRYKQPFYLFHFLLCRLLRTDPDIVIKQLCRKKMEEERPKQVEDLTL